MWPLKTKQMKPLVVIRRTEPLKWTAGDMQAMRAFIEKGAGYKAVQVIEDCISTYLNGSMDLSIAVQRAKGMTEALDLLIKLAGKNRYTGQAVPIGEVSLSDLENDEIPTTIQEDTDE